MQETPGLNPESGRFPGEGIGYPIQYSCLENPHGQRSLAGYCPWGCKESDTTEQLSTAQYKELSFPGGTVVKNLSANAGDTGDVGSIPGSGRSPGVRNGNPLQYSCLGNPMDTRAWQTTVHGVTKSQTRLSTHTA